MLDKQQNELDNFGNREQIIISVLDLKSELIRRLSSGTFISENTELLRRLDDCLAGKKIRRD